MSSILGRKRDIIYLLFFLTHIPVIFFIDSYTLWPASLRPEFMTTLRNFYIETYADQFFTSPPAWFGLYLWFEILYHIPLSFWAVKALVNDDPALPIHLLVFATQTAVTTATCIADYMSWEGFSSEQKLELGKLYVPYLALSVFMAVDMIGRLHGMAKNSMTGGKKRQ